MFKNPVIRRLVLTVIRFLVHATFVKAGYNVLTEILLPVVTLPPLSFTLACKVVAIFWLYRDTDYCVKSAISEI